MRALNPILLSGREVLPLVEGGKGISVSNGASSGAWAASGGVGTFSGVNADAHDETGALIPVVYRGRTRRERHDELVAYAIKGGVTQARIAHETAGGEGRIHVNVLWEMGGAVRVLEGVLEGARGLIHGVTCGAGMPYRIAEIAARFRVHYYPIVSSARAFRALWKRAYHRFPEWLGGVVYEDPWRAGGHNGLSNSEDAETPEAPYPRVHALRKTMRGFGLDALPVFMAGGVWRLREWEDWIDNPELGPVAFQFGTRPLLTDLRRLEGASALAFRGRHPSQPPQPDGLLVLGGQQRLHARAEGADGKANRLHDRAARRAPGRLRNRAAQADGLAHRRRPGQRRNLGGAGLYGGDQDPRHHADIRLAEKAAEIRADQTACMGCLSACHFSNWSQADAHTTGRKADPRRLLHPEDSSGNQPRRTTSTTS